MSKFILFLTVSILIINEVSSFWHCLQRVPSKTFRVSAELDHTWPGNRIPFPNPAFLDQKMDAAWGRGKFRTEVWDDDVNPITDWWSNYAPSEDEIQAAKAGFDFKNPQGWCEANGLNYEDVVKSSEIEFAPVLAAYREQKLVERSTMVTETEFKANARNLLETLDLVYKQAFRLEDNRLQLAKGQPSLDNEDTGVQYKIEKVV